ncbi:hypothetical protein [Kocuria massiliensis]|uniref:hypothetical protein n=1 Tax=Kocuria massiliensis TaxID=1926282 RepID=UPI0022B958B4|nr:hypothetical protein [Kocuria massiliensis]
MSDNPQGPTGNQPPQFGGNSDQGAPQYQGGNQPYGQQGGAPQYQNGNQPYGQPQYQGNDYGQRNALDRPKAVKTASVLVFIVGGLTALAALFLLLGGLAASSSSEAEEALGGVMTPGPLIGLGVLELVLGLVLIFAGVAVRKGKNWGRVAILVIAILLLVIFIISLIGGNFSGIVSLVLVVVATIQLWRGEGAAWFNALQGKQQAR